MEIKGVGNINPMDKFPQKKSVQTPSTIKSIDNKDSLNVSDEARFLEDEAFIKEVLARIPDISQERINAVKQRLEDGTYDKQETINHLTEQLMKTLGL